MADTELTQLQKIGESGGRNPIQETRYKELLRTQGAGGGGADINSVLAKQRADTQAILDRQNAEQNALFDVFKTQSAGQEKIGSAYSRLAGEQGIPGLQTSAAIIQGEIGNVKALIDRLEQDVTTRTAGTLTSEAQRRRTVAAERTPLSDTLGRLATGLDPVTRALETAQGNVGTQLSLTAQEQAKELRPAEMQISALSDRFAREMTGYNQDKQSELSAVLAKISRDEALSDREWQSAQQLASEERSWQQTKEKMEIEQKNALQLKLTKAGGTGSVVNPYLSTSGTTVKTGANINAMLDWNKPFKNPLAGLPGLNFGNQSGFSNPTISKYTFQGY
mgnify:FL=1